MVLLGINFMIPFFASLVGIVAYERLSISQRLLSLQISTWVLVLFISYVVTDYQKAFFIEQNNLWLFNISLLLETGFLLSAAYMYLKDPGFRYLILIFALIFLVTYIVRCISGSFFDYFNFLDAFECMIMVVLSGYILYREIYLFNSRSNTPGLLCMVLGLFIYFAGSVPYISFFDELKAGNAQHTSFFILTTDTLANTRYMLLAIGFATAFFRSKPLLAHE